LVCIFSSSIERGKKKKEEIYSFFIQRDEHFAVGISRHTPRDKTLNYKYFITKGMNIYYVFSGWLSKNGK
jgi:predicted branched-subunit amino acid permease